MLICSDSTFNINLEALMIIITYYIILSFQMSTLLYMQWNMQGECTSSDHQITFFQFSVILSVRIVFHYLVYHFVQSLKYNQVQFYSYFTARSFSGKLTGILLSKLENGNEKMKIGMLTVFKHLINAASKIQYTRTVLQTESLHINNLFL